MSKSNIVDIFDIKASNSLQLKSDFSSKHSYCLLKERPDALFIGLPPSYHGAIDDPKADIELQLAKV